MGSLTSRPDITPVQQPVFVPVQQPAPQPAPVQNDAATESEAPQEESAEEQERRTQQERETGLLRRSRGRLGTVLTSFRGLLSDSVKSGQRKTLLGE